MAKKKNNGPDKSFWMVTFSDLLSVFVPTTPNPTSGFLLFFPREDVIELDMSVEDAAKLVISAGLVYPGQVDPEDPRLKRG